MKEIGDRKERETAYWKRKEDESVKILMDSMIDPNEDEIRKLVKDCLLFVRNSGNQLY